MTDKNSKNFFSNQLSTLVPGFILAIAILAVIGVIYWSGDRPPPDDEISGSPTDVWPTRPPTFTPIASATPIPTATSTPTPTPLPPPKWGELGHLASIEYTEQTVVEIERERSLGGVISLTRDRILLLAVGEIQVGVDLSQIEEQDVDIEDTSIELTLPRAVVTSVELLPDQSQVFDQERSFLFSQYEGIEIEALEKAKTQLTEQANKDQNMLGLGERMAKLQLEKFLNELGFEEVEIKFKGPNL